MDKDAWGDAVILQELADMLNANIKVIFTNNATTPLITPQAAQSQVQEGSTINLGLIFESHYTALQVLPDDHQVSESPEMSKTQSKGAEIGSEEAEADSASNEMEKEDEAAFEKRRKTAGLAHASCLQQDLDWDESVFAIAPAEGERPLSFFNDTFFEEMANPDKYPTGRMGFSQQRQVPLSMRRFYNQRLLNADGRFAKDVDYLFTAQYATECKQIHSDVGICLRQTKGTLQAGQNVTAGTVKNTAKLQEIIRKDQAYKFLKNVRGSPAYWQKTLYDLLAMIRQLGIPTWFFTLSAADLVWPDMIQSIALQHGCFFTENEVQAMTWEEKSHWIRQNPVTTARHFQYRLDNIMNKFIQSEAAPLGVVTDHFHVIEFQARGSPHTHGLLWIKDAPVLDEDSEDDICTFIDRYITCSRQESNKCFQTLVERFQTHHHSSSCRKYKNMPCRFSYPRPPTMKTLISRIPDGDDRVDYDPVLKAVRTEIEKNETNGQTLLQILKKVNVTEELYEEALKTSKKGCTVVMKRELDEVWTNSYNLELLRTWKANIDVQFVLDPYACIMYIVSYMIKGENCIGDLLQAAAKEASSPDIKAQMKKVASTFLNSREVSAQEAVYRQLSMPLKKSSRQVVFINTNPKEKRVAMLKRQDIIDNMSDEDDNIFQTSLLDRYQARPQALEEITLAEFTANYKTLYLKNDGHNQDQMNSGNRFYLQHGLGTMTKRISEAVIRYHRPNITKQPEEFYRTALMMYFPWREETEIIGQYDSYLEAYQDRYDTLHEVEARYSKHGPIVDHACNVLGKEGPPEHAWAQIAPTAEQERHEDEAEGYEELPGIDAADLAANADIIENDETRQSPIEAIAAKFTAESVEERMTRDSYLQSMRGLNTQQYTILHHHRQWLKNFVSSLKEGKKQPPPYQLFLSGPGGVGKSHVIHLIHYETVRLFRLAGVCRPQDVPALLLAPTGTAAFNIGGMTIHSALLLSPNNARRFVPPSADRLNTLRERLSSLKLIIIDEISMVGSDLLHMIHKSMSYIMGSKELFGNVSVLAVGDLFQLQPVRQRHVFLPTTDSTAQFADLWRSYFSFFQLTKVMRQKDIEFAELLNRMRTGDLTETDINTLTSRDIKYHPNYPTDIMHVFTTNHKVDCHNEDKLKTLEGPIYSLECTDYRKDRHTQHLTVTPSIKHTETGGLRKYLQLAIGARVMLTSNVDVSDGLVNGAIGTVAGFIFQQEDVSTVLILFDNNRVGRAAKQQSSYICQYPEAVPIARIEVVFCVGTRQSVQMSRKQFPLTLAWACTIHKVQGMTMKSILVSMSGRFMPGQAYVACSRVTSLNGLFIEDFTPSKIRANPMVQEETQRLQICQIETALHHQCLSSPSIISISCLNIRSYRKYQEELCRSKVLADIMCFQETKLTAVMEDQLNFPPGYSHQNQAVSGNKHGLLCCVSPKLKGKVLHLYTELKIEVQALLISKLNMDLLVINIYRSPTVPWTQFKADLEATMDSLPHQELPTIIVGDFNEDLISCNPLHTRLPDFMAEHHFQQLVDRATTDQGSLLDHVYFNASTKFNINMNIIDAYFTDHDFVVMQLSPRAIQNEE